MPRLPRTLLARARKENALLPLLLQTCRDLASARRELAWLAEHARKISSSSSSSGQSPASNFQPRPSRPSWRRRGPRHRSRWESLLRGYCVQRGRGTPLQYILGSEFFGELEIQCRRRVLIPRQETAASVTHLVRLLARQPAALPPVLRVLDLCTGTGCISLLFAHLFERDVMKAGEKGHQVHVLGVDIAQEAIDLARLNRRQLFGAGTSSQRPDVRFIRADIFGDNPTSSVHCQPHPHDGHAHREWDILIANPPYISPNQFKHVTARSVRNFEPKLALVPQDTCGSLSDDAQGDLFYPRLLQLAQDVDVKMLLVEVGDLEQARRVARLAGSSERWQGVEIWRDEPDAAALDTVQGIPVMGSGHGRSVFCWRDQGASWLGMAGRGDQRE